MTTILYFINIEDQLNSKRLRMKLCVRLPKFQLQSSLKLSVQMQFDGRIFDFQCPILFVIRLLLKRNKNERFLLRL